MDTRTAPAGKPEAVRASPWVQSSTAAVGMAPRTWPGVVTTDAGPACSHGNGEASAVGQRGHAWRGAPAATQVGFWSRARADRATAVGVATGGYRQRRMWAEGRPWRRMATRLPRGCALLGPPGTRARADRRSASVKARVYFRALEPEAEEGLRSGRRGPLLQAVRHPCRVVWRDRWCQHARGCPQQSPKEAALARDDRRVLRCVLS